MPLVGLTGECKLPLSWSFRPDFFGVLYLFIPWTYKPDNDHLTYILVQVLCVCHQSPKHYIEIWHERPFSLHYHYLDFLYEYKILYFLLNCWLLNLFFYAKNFESHLQHVYLFYKYNIISHYNFYDINLLCIRYVSNI